MNDLFAILFSILAGYLLGSVNFSIILSRMRYRDDIRRHGSGNAGMTNTLRTYGKLSAVLGLLGDAAKGFLAGWIGLELGGPVTMYLAGLFAVAGHMFPIFFGFRGGKGVATAAGFILYSSLPVCLGLAVVFLAVVFFSRYVSLGSVTVAALYPFAIVFMNLPPSWWQEVGWVTLLRPSLWVILLCAFLMAALVLWAHRSNIRRLLAGTENKLGQKKG